MKYNGEMAAQLLHFTIAEKIPPHALVLIETTVAPGTTEQVAYPIMKKAFKKRGIPTDPLLAHSYERVMPGRDYVASIRDFWRVCSGINEEAFIQVITSLSALLEAAPEVFEMDINPLLASGDKIVAVDARIRVEKG